MAIRYTSSGQTSWQVKEDSLQHTCETKSEVKVVLEASLHVLELERVPKVRVASASPADRVSRLSAIQARVQQLPDKYIGTSISIETQKDYDSGHQDISHIGIQVAGWTSSIAIRQKSLKQCIQPPTASTTRAPPS
jgi:hypothetical protein